MIYDLSDKSKKEFEYWGSTLCDESYYIYGKLSKTEIKRKDSFIELNLSNKGEMLFKIDKKFFLKQNIDLNKVYVVKIESNVPGIPIIEKFIYNVTEKIWMI